MPDALTGARDGECGFEDLPIEVKWVIFHFLSAEEVIRIEGVCREWKEILRDDEFWRPYAYPWCSSSASSSSLRIMYTSWLPFRRVLANAQSSSKMLPSTDFSVVSIPDLFKVRGHSSHAVCVAHDGNRVYTSAWDRTVRSYPLDIVVAQKVVGATAKPIIFEHSENGEQVRSLSLKGDYMFCGCNSLLSKWHKDDAWEAVAQGKQKEGMDIMGIQHSVDGQYVYTCSKSKTNGGISVWNSGTLALLQYVSTPEYVHWSCLLSGAGDVLYTGGSHLCAWNVEADRIASTPFKVIDLTPHVGSHYIRNITVFQKILYAACSSGDIVAISQEEMTYQHHWKADSKGVQCMDGIGEFLFTGGKSGDMQAWPTRVQNPSPLLKVHFAYWVNSIKVIGGAVVVGLGGGGTYVVKCKLL